MGHRSTEWCPRCGTSISAHELHGHYEDRLDPSLYVRFPLLDREGEWIVVWTTTPWTLPANVAAAVNPEADYGLLENGEWVACALFPDETLRAGREGRRARRPALRRAVRHARARLGRRASRDPVGRRRARHRHRHRPHRARLRRRGLRALEGARPRRAHARRRGRPLLPRVRLAARPLDRSRRPSRSSATSATAGCSCGPRRPSTATRSAGAATRR